MSTGYQAKSLSLLGVVAMAGFLAARELDIIPGAAAANAEPSVSGFIAALALGVLAFKGFTTITNSGSEIVDPHRNVGRAIILSIAICVVIYLLVALAVDASLTLPRDYRRAKSTPSASRRKARVRVRPSLSHNTTTTRRLPVRFRLTKEQADYIGVSQDGPFKAEHYRY